MKKIETKKLVIIALLVALGIVLSRYLSIQTPIVRVGFGFLPNVVIAMLFGPVYAAFGAAAADFLGTVLFSGDYFPGFTITAFLAGLVYGFFIYKHEKDLVRISIAVIIVATVLNLGLNTYWLKILLNEGYLALLPTRIVKAFVMVPIEIICIRAVAGRIGYMK
ncbi:MAG: folate family ECF transporter S component [Clostridiales bacterium]|nr:folate family ECF transporter S component [Clostridiales bacterium]